MAPRRTCVGPGLGGCLVALMLLVVLAGLPASASAAFTPGRYVVKGKRLANGAGKGLSVYLHPGAISLERCRTRKAKVQHARGAVSLRATIRCGKRKLKLVARVRGKRLRGRVVRRGKDRRFKARRARRVGVLLKGKRSRQAIRAVRKVDRLRGHRRDEISKLGRARVARTELVVRLKRTATVGQLNGLLRALGAGIVGSLKRSPALIVAIPDPGSARALKRIARRGARRRGIASVLPSELLDEQALPPGIATPPSAGQLGALSHLLASGVGAAWNARGAIKPSQAPTVVQADNFGDGALSPHVNADSAPRILTPAELGGLSGRSHGYQVASIIFGDFASDGTPAGLVTGVFPPRGKLVVVDRLVPAGELTLAATGQRLIETLDSVPFNVVLNTSLGRNGGQPDRDMFPEAADWIRNVQNHGLEQRVLHASSAGNDANSARFNGLWAASALRSDITDYLTEGKVGPLSNTLAVEGLEEKPDLSALGCKFPTSNVDGTIAAPGGDIYSLDRDGRVASRVERDGTSFSTPVITGIATYLWSVAPDLTPQQLKAAMIENGQRVDQTEQNCVSAPRLDAYAAVLSLDQPGTPSPAGYPVRTAILDVNRKDGFNEEDLVAFKPVAAGRRPTARDWSRFDLNGDGYTGGDWAAPFDLDRTGSARAGAPRYDEHLTATIDGVRTELDEEILTDSDILCYYAYSELYTGTNPAARKAAIKDVCVTIEINPPTATLNPGAQQQFTATVKNATNTDVTWSASRGTISQSGLYTAPQAPGTYTVTARSKQDPTKTATATALVTEKVSDPIVAVESRDEVVDVLACVPAHEERDANLPYSGIWTASVDGGSGCGGSGTATQTSDVEPSANGQAWLKFDASDSVASTNISVRASSLQDVGFEVLKTGPVTLSCSGNYTRSGYAEVFIVLDRFTPEAQTLFNGSTSGASGPIAASVQIGAGSRNNHHQLYIATGASATPGGDRSSSATSSITCEFNGPVGIVPNN